MKQCPYRTTSPYLFHVSKQCVLDEGHKGEHTHEQQSLEKVE